MRLPLFSAEWSLEQSFRKYRTMSSSRAFSVPGVVQITQGERGVEPQKLSCVSYGGVDNTGLTLVNRCDKCMAGSIYWTKWSGGSFVRTYNVPALSAIKIALKGESSSLIAENPC